MHDPAKDGGAAGVNPVGALAVYLAAVFLGAASLAPWLWKSAQWMAREHGVGVGLASQPFHRYVNRCLIGLALLLLWPLVRAFRFRGWEEIGWRWDAIERRRWLGGFGLGFVALGIFTVVALAGGARVLNPPGDAGKWIGKLLGFAAVAVGVALLEELLFRGAVFSAIRRRAGFATAAGVTSAVYAIVHFFARPESPVVIDAGSGFRILGLMFHGFVDPRLVVPGLASLFVAGWTLAILRDRTGGLMAPMGLHAGWIFWLRAYGWLTTDAPGADTRWWGTEKLYDGWVAFALLAGLGIWVHVRTRPPDHDSRTRPTDR